MKNRTENRVDLAYKIFFPYFYVKIDFSSKHCQDPFKFQKSANFSFFKVILLFQQKNIYVTEPRKTPTIFLEGPLFLLFNEHQIWYSKVPK